jgi:hypothetical protein
MEALSTEGASSPARRGSFWTAYFNGTLSG